MTRLAIVRQKYNAAGGAERFVSRALDALQASGAIEVGLIARKWEALKDVQACMANPFYLGNLWRDWGFAHAARQLWRDKKFDLVQSHERIPGCHIYRAGDGVHRQWLKLRATASTPFSTLSTWLNPYHHYVKYAEKAMFLDPALKLVICNSHMVKQEIQHYFGLPDNRFAVIYNGVDTQEFHPSLKAHYRQSMRQQWDIPYEVPLLVYVGSGFERKGVARAIEVLALCPDVYLMVVGKDKHAARYKSLAKQLGVGGRVKFTGAQTDVKPYYAMADGFILPTLYDPFPNVCVEAMACGLPVFTTRQCGAAELIEQGNNGWVCDALDTVEMSNHVKQWLVRRSQWPVLQQSARATAEPLTLTAMVEKLLHHYRALI